MHWLRARRSLQRFVNIVVARSRGARGEGGDTLIEVLLALIVLSLASVALITAFETNISASAEHRNLANFDTALASSLALTSSVIQDGYTSVFSACPVPANSLAGYPSESVLTNALDINGFTAQIAASATQPAVEYSAGTSVTTNSYTTTCTNPSGNSPGNVGEPQLINVVVTDTATGISQNDTVIVVDPTPVQASGSNSNSASQIVFITEPEGATVDTPFTTQPAIEILDSNGRIVTSNFSSITISLDPDVGTPGAVLSPCLGQETSGIIEYSGCSINEVGGGYELKAVEGSGTTELTAYSAPFSVYSAQLATPTITNVAPSSAQAGALTVTFTSPPNSQAFTARACTDQAMSLNCVSAASITSGGSITGLTQGTSYYVQVTATATGNYLAATSPPYLPAVMATVQLVAPSGVSATAGTVAGSLVVNFTPPSIIASNQTYTVAACTVSAMNQGCVTNTNFSPDSTLTGLTYTAGSSTPSYYYVDVLANASTGYLASPPSSPPVKSSVESAVKTPTGFSTAPSASQPGSITAAFMEQTVIGGIAPSSFTATVCTNSAMNAGCITVPNYTSNSQISGLTPGSSYYVTVTAVSSTVGYASATTAVSAATMATVQLAAPTGLSTNFGTAAGSVTVSFTAPVGAPTGQTYTAEACPTSAMTGTGCVTNENYVSGTNLLGLAYTPGSPGSQYYIEVTANASSGYLVSPVSSQVSQVDASQMSAPSVTVVPSTTTAGALSVAYTASSGTAPASYTLEYCTGAQMTGTCTTVTNYTSGTAVTGLTAGATYYATVTAVTPSLAYVSASSSVESGLATLQLAAPTYVSYSGSTTGTGTITVNFTESGTVPSGQSYTAEVCTGAGMTGTCKTVTGVTASPARITGVGATTYDYLTITANASTGYLAKSTTVTGTFRE